MMQRLTRYFMFAYFYYNIIPILQLFAEVISHQEVITFKSQSNAWYPWHNHNHHSTFVGFVFSFLIQASAEFAAISFIMSGEFLFCFLNTQLQLHFDYLTGALSALDARSPNALLHLKTLINYHNQLLR
ncbi:putative odorant receptor 69a [Ceratitis capitata]|uniref:putative odorant receptor 69a n=1 Tax=Ceratitis capitata TaxID=7213 RepID=UPI000A0F7A3D|nr:putative odorant receptor 69a [Ceratitis capitata]